MEVNILSFMNTELIYCYFHALGMQIAGVGGAADTGVRVSPLPCKLFVKGDRSCRQFRSQTSLSPSAAPVQSTAGPWSGSAPTQQTLPGRGGEERMGDVHPGAFTVCMCTLLGFALPTSWLFPGCSVGLHLGE